METVIGARPRQDTMTSGYDTVGQVIIHPTGVVQTLEKVDLQAARATLVARKDAIDAQIASMDADIATVIRLESGLTDADIADLMDSFVPWITAEAVSVGILRKHNDALYKCLQAHTTQADWTPDVVPALWLHVVPAGVIPDFVQPTGAHDAYQTGDQVIFEGGIWESLINANGWSPTAYPAGWTRIGDAL